MYFIYLCQDSCTDTSYNETLLRLVPALNLVVPALRVVPALLDSCTDTGYNETPPAVSICPQSSCLKVDVLSYLPAFGIAAITCVLTSDSVAQVRSLLALLVQKYKY